MSDKSDCSLEDTGDIICTVPCHASAVCVRQGSQTRTVSDMSDCSFRDSGDITFGSFAMPISLRAFKADHLSDRSDNSLGGRGGIIFGSFAMSDYVRAFKAARRVLSV